MFEVGVGSAAQRDSNPLMIAAGRLKARQSIALEDCFAVVTAAAQGLVLLTGDPQILGMRDSPCETADLRPP